MAIINNPPYEGTPEDDLFFVSARKIKGRSDELVSAGAGDDIVYWTVRPDQNVTAHLGQGDDVFHSQHIARRATAEPAPKLKVNGGTGNDIIYGTINADAIFGGAGDDALFSDPKDYVYVPFEVPDKDIIHGGIGNDLLVGHSQLYGDEGNDHLVATGTKSSHLFGGKGDDRLDAGGHAGVDLWGEEGADIFAYNRGVVHDFSAQEGDRLDLPFEVTSIGTEFDPTPGHIWVRTFPRSGVEKIYYTDSTGSPQLMELLPRGIDIANAELSWFI